MKDKPLRIDASRGERTLFPETVLPWRFDVTPEGITLFFAGNCVVGPTRDHEQLFQALSPLTPETVCLMQDLCRVWGIMSQLHRTPP